jgi:hypothetical protein
MSDFPKLVPRMALLAGLLSATALHGADGLQAERISAAYVLAAGHVPTSDEIAAEEKSGESVSELVTRLSQSPSGGPANRANVARQAYVDCFGVEPSADDLAHASGNYTAQLNQHLQHLAAHREAYAKVVERAYQRVIRRDPYAEEITYWNRYDVASYALLSAAIENWARRNQPGLMVTSGEPTVSVNSLYLAAVRLSPVVADEVAAALGAPRTRDDSDRVRAIARTVLSPGGAQLISNGAIAFVAAGRVSD